MNAEAVKARLTAAANAIVANRDALCEADRATGDGDHGVGMARGLGAAKAALETTPIATPADAFRTIGIAILSASGGASGAVFGSYFLGLAKGAGSGDLTRDSFAAALAEGAAAVATRGGAKRGGKTMLDAAYPAAEAAAGASSLEHALLAAAAGAEEGANATIGMLASTGKAKTLGERAIGHIDPGAKSLAIILRAFADQNA
jgi:dihydroxyacetone kinase-like protein